MPAVVAIDLLARACPGGVREATGDDAVAGVAARWVARPTSIEQAADLMRACDEQALSVVARGGGTKLDWGLPPRQVDVVLDTTGLDVIVDHAAGDLVAIVQGGVRLEALQEHLSRAKQELAIDQPVPKPSASASTIGGVVSCATAGPRRLLRGGPRDLVIGATIIRADGVVAKAGGKVVKNVAGYDLARLVCGAYGTLGLVAQVAFRLHPSPSGRSWVCVDVASVEEVRSAVAAVLGSNSVPSALEVLRRPSGWQVATLLEGTVRGVESRAAQLQALLGHSAVVLPSAPDGVGVLPGSPDDVLLKVTFAVPGLPAVLAALQRGDVTEVSGSAGAGVLHAALPGETEPASVAQVLAEVRDLTARYGGSTVVLRAPEPVRAGVDLWGPVPALELMRRLKDQFDPGHRLAPGRFVGGI